MSSTVFGRTALGTYEGPDIAPGPRMHCMSGDCIIPRAPIDGGEGGDGPGDGSPRTILPIRKSPPSDGGTGPSDGGSTGSTGSGGSGNDTNSTSPEFNALMNALNGMSAAGAPISPYLQDNGTPTVVPTQSTSKSATLAIILFIIAGALGYYYYRKHGGPSVHEAL